MLSKCLIKIILPCFTSVAFFLSFAWSARSHVANQQETGAEGQAIFRDKCSKCHSLKSSGQLDPEELAHSLGPTLAFAGSKFQPQWLEKWLVSPGRVRLAGYLSYRHVVSTPAGDRIDEATLPSHPALSSAEAKFVAEYLTTLKKEPNLFPSSEEGTTVSAQVHFEKILGCGSCHQARAGQGGLSGPELYTAYERLNRDWTAAFIAEPNYWNTVPMPKVSVRADQLTAISDYLFRQPAEKSTSTGQVNGSHPVGKGAPSPASRAEILYQVFCSQCHGIQGNGKGINAPYMFVSPRNHTSTEEMGMLTDDRLYAVVRYGGTAVGKSALMPPWGGVLKDSDIKLLVEYVRTLSNTGPSGER